MRDWLPWLFQLELRGDHVHAAGRITSLLAQETDADAAHDPGWEIRFQFPWMGRPLWHCQRSGRFLFLFLFLLPGSYRCLSVLDRLFKNIWACLPEFVSLWIEGLYHSIPISSKHTANNFFSMLVTQRLASPVVNVPHLWMSLAFSDLLSLECNLTREMALCTAVIQWEYDCVEQ